MTPWNNVPLAKDKVMVYPQRRLGLGVYRTQHQHPVPDADAEGPCPGKVDPSAFTLPFHRNQRQKNCECSVIISNLDV